MRGKLICIMKNINKKEMIYLKANNYREKIRNIKYH